MEVVWISSLRFCELHPDNTQKDCLICWKWINCSFFDLRVKNSKSPRVCLKAQNGLSKNSLESGPFIQP